MKRNTIFRSVVGFALALIMAASMVVSGATPVLAEGDASITIQPNGQALTPENRFTAYQVFLGTVDDTVDQLSNLEWGSGVDSNALVTAMKSSPLPLDGSTFGDKFTAAWIDWNSNFESQLGEAAFVAQWLSQNTNKAQYADDFARIVAANTKGEGVASAIEGKNWTIKGLDPGYYLVKDSYDSDKHNSEDNSDGSVSSYILQVLGHVEINLKASVPTVDKKVDGSEGLLTETNQIANFTLIGTVAENIGEYNTYSYKFTDKLSKGLTMETSDLDTLSVKLVSTNNGGVLLNKQSDSTGYTVTLAPNDNAEGTDHTLTIIFADLKAAIKAVVPTFNFNDVDEVRSVKIVVSYTAKLNQYAVVGQDGNTNSVVLEYANDPYEEGTGKTIPDEPRTYTLALRIVKHDEKDQPMAGVKFKLKKGEQYATLVEVKSADPNNPYTSEAETYYAITDWIASPGGTELATDEQGIINIHGLDVGTYMLEETSTKEGYELMEPVTFTIEGTEVDDNGALGGNITVNKDSLTNGRKDVVWNNGQFDSHNAQLTLKNFKSPILPHTGGIGRTVILGISVVVVLAGIVVVALALRPRKRKGKHCA